MKRRRQRSRAGSSSSSSRGLSSSRSCEQQWVELAGLSKDDVGGAEGRGKPVGSSRRVATPFGCL
jgi:hypothetical protein